MITIYELRKTIELNNKPKCFGDMLETASYNICGNCSVSTDCKIKTKQNLYTFMKDIKFEKNSNN